MSGVITVVQFGQPKVWLDASADYDEFENNGKTHLYVENMGAGDVDVTIIEQRQPSFPFDHHAQTNIVQTCPVGAVTLIRHLPRYPFNASNGRVRVEVSDETSVRYAAVSD